jgi:TonB-dependent receptor
MLALNRSSGRSASQRSRIRRAIRAVLGMSAVAAAMTAVAQEDAGKVEEVIVTGFRQSLEKSLDLKREESGAVDGIFAEDIADFPDANLAESIQRIPGVTIERVGGEGRQVSIRGLSPEFSRVRINGMEALTTTSATDSLGTNRTRAFDFNVFASELFNQIAVRKTAVAEVDEGSLGATIDLYTARPLDFKGLKVVTSYQEAYSELADKLDPRAVGLVSYTNDSQTLGFLFSAAYSKRHIVEEGGQSGGWERNSNTTADRWQSVLGVPTTCLANGTNCTPADLAVHARFPRYAHFEHEQERLGLTGSVQWQPTDSTTLSFDVLHSKLDAKRREPFLEAISMSRGNAAGRGATDVLAYQVDSNNTMVYGVFDDVDVRSESREDVWNTEFNQYTLALDQAIGERFKINALVGTSKSELEVEKATTVILERFDADGFVYDFRGNKEKPYVQYGFDVSNPANWLVSELRDRPSTQSNGFDTARVEGSYELNDVFTLKSGVSWKEFEFKVRALTRDRVLPATPTATCNITQTPVTAAMGRSTPIVDDLSIPAGMQRNFFLADINAVTSQLGFYTNQTCFPLTALPADVRKVVEADTGAHVQVDFKTEVLGLPFRGDVGVRYVETDMDSSGVQVVGTDQVPVTISRKYKDTLPAVNLALEVHPDVILRAAYAKVMSRPALGSLSPGGSVNAFSVPPVVTFGNPDLDPFRADAYDISAEWYFAPEALLSVAFFKKDIESFTVQDTRRGVPFNTLGLPDSLVRPPATVNDLFDVVQVINGFGGKLDGFEIQYQQPFTFLPGPQWLRNFGTILNYTSVDSEVNFAAPSSPPNVRSLNGQSDKTANFTLYYENDKFSARISAAYRDSFQRSATSRAGNDIDFTQEATNVDFSTSYKWSEHLKFSLEALNLTDEYRTDLQDTQAERVDNSLHTGTLYFLGVQYSL